MEECMKERYGLAKERIREIITEETVKTVWRFFQKHGKVSFHGEADVMDESSKSLRWRR